MTPAERQRIRDSIALALAVASRHPSAQHLVTPSAAAVESDEPRQDALPCRGHLRLIHSTDD